MPDSIYLDHNASTPLLPEVIDAMRACYEGPLLNPSSQHEFGRRARQALEEAREKIAQLLGANMTGMNADQLLFTSGGTEANNLAMRGILEEGAHPLGHLIISEIEHPSVSVLAEQLLSEGWQIDRLGVDSRGVLEVDQLAPLFRPDTRLVCVILGHNETGILQPVHELATLCQEKQIPLHTDAAQVVGKLPVNFTELGVTTLSLAAHKFHGPLGIGALLVRDGVTLRPQLFGGFQQAGLRPGTESVALAVGMARALELWHAEQEERIPRLTSLRDRFERAIWQGWPETVVIGAEVDRLPHTSTIALVGLDRQALFMALDQAGVACSTGSACASGSSEPSPVLLAMGHSDQVAQSALRFSLGATTTEQEIDQAAARLLKIAGEMRQKS